MTQLKQLWRTLPEEERERWREVFVSNLPSAEIREKIRAELNIGLAHDMQLCRFRDWAEREREQEEVEEGLEEDVLFFEKRFGTDEASAQARKKMLACSYARALRRGNYQDVLRTMRADNRVPRHIHHHHIGHGILDKAGAKPSWGVHPICSIRANA